jgi:hypothetical protein
MRQRYFFLFSMIILLLGCATVPVPKEPAEMGVHWRAVHLLDYDTDEKLDELGKAIPEFVRMGINVVILEMNYNFDYKTHPELRRGDSPVTDEAARTFATTCRRHGIRLIPQFQSLGHQSWEEETFPLLTEYPEFDTTPGAYPENKGIYCREWDPLNPRINPIIFALMDELIDAFDADAFHVGMDEVFLLGDEFSPSTIGKDPAELFAKIVNEIYDHLVTERGVEMLMWGDRLIDGEKYDYGEWESAVNGTAPAVDMIPKDIIICDWHYEQRADYPSIPMFIEKGFRVLPAGFKNVEATKSLIRYSQNQDSPLMLGYLFTTWGAVKQEVTMFPPILEGTTLLNKLSRKKSK